MVWSSFDICEGSMENDGVDLTEDSLMDALQKISVLPLRGPTELLVTEHGIALQAARLKEGLITEDGMRKAGVPEDLIALVVELAR